MQRIRFVPLEQLAPSPYSDDKLRLVVETAGDVRVITVFGTGSMLVYRATQGLGWANARQNSQT
jgi:hypothetical protein